MSTALETFKKQQQAVEALHQQATDLAALIASIKAELDAIARHDARRNVLLQEQRWLERTEDAVRAVAAWRAGEAQHFWPWMLRRWLVACTFALACAAAAGAGHAWVVKPYANENTYLRARNGFAAALERRMLAMTPRDRHKLEALLSSAPPAR